MPPRLRNQLFFYIYKKTSEHARTLGCTGSFFFHAMASRADPPPAASRCENNVVGMPIIAYSSDPLCESVVVVDDESDSDCEVNPACASSPLRCECVQARATRWRALERRRHRRRSGRVLWCRAILWGGASHARRDVRGRRCAVERFSLARQRARCSWPLLAFLLRLRGAACAAKAFSLPAQVAAPWGYAAQGEELIEERGEFLRTPLEAARPLRGSCEAGTEFGRGPML